MISARTIHTPKSTLAPRASSHAMAAGNHTPRRTAGRALMAAVEWLWKRYQHRKAMHALMALNDHELKDIGLPRSGIADAVRTGRDRSSVTATG